MSHVAKVDLVIQDLDALEAACKRLGCTFDRNAVDWKWWGRWANDYGSKDAAYRSGIPVDRYGKADAGVISVPGATWQIGCYKDPKVDGQYCLAYDFFGSQGEAIHKVAGAGLVELKQHYGALVAGKQLVAKGFKVREERDAATGRLRVIGTRLPQK